MIAYGHPGPRELNQDDAILRFETDRPEIGEFDILLCVGFVGMNPIDAKLRSKGKATTEAPRILGFEGSGWVEATGTAVRGFVPGDRVAWLGQVDRPGATAEFTVVDHRLVAHVPETLSLEDAAAVPMTFVTAHGLLLDRMGLSSVDDGALLIVNGGGGVGSAAIQVARKMTRMQVIATASRAASRDWCLAMGAHAVIDHRQSISDGLQAIGYKEVEAIASLTNTEENFPGLISILAPHGTLGIIDQPTTLDMTGLKARAHTLAFEGAFVPALMKPTALVRQFMILTQSLQLVSEGDFLSTRNGLVTDVSCQTLIEAHKNLEAGTNIGKQVMKTTRTA